MNKSKISAKPVLKFLRELAVVVTGIGITVGTGLWVNNHNIKKDQKQYLNAIILELKENAENFYDFARRLQKSVGYSNYLYSHDEKSLNIDSINYYAYDDADGLGWGNHNPEILYNEDAFEMFKSSGAMRQIDDKELLLSIWRVYHLMGSTQKYIDAQLQYKREEGMRERQMIDDGKVIVGRQRWFYINYVPLLMKKYCESTMEFIRETVSELEKSKIIK